MELKLTLPPLTYKMDTGPKFVSLEMEDSSKLKQGTY